ncbi:MAG TPA: hypothetical protein VK718_03840, partial [Ferruginibacter sp.]|nr:hypothetical protein [Ferruginibacter sp.]
MATVPAQRTRQNHAQHVLAVAKVALEQERSPAAMSDQRNPNIIHPWWNKKEQTIQKAIIMLFKAFPLFLPPKFTETMTNLIYVIPAMGIVGLLYTFIKFAWVSKQ